MSWRVPAGMFIVGLSRALGSVSGSGLLSVTACCLAQIAYSTLSGDSQAAPSPPPPQHSARKVAAMVVPHHGETASPHMVKESGKWVRGTLNTLTHWHTHADNTLNTPTFYHSHAHTLPSQNTRHLPPLLAVNGHAAWERRPGLPPLLPKALQPSLSVLTLSRSFQLPLGAAYSPNISVLMRSACESILFDSFNFTKHAGKC